MTMRATNTGRALTLSQKLSMLCGHQDMETQSSIAAPELHQDLDRWLLEQMAEGDEAALGEFYDRYHHLVYSFALRVMGSSTEAEDVVVDVFWQLWQQARQYDPERGTVAAWLMTITRSRTIDRHRVWRQRRRREETLDVARSNSSQTTDPEENTITANRRRVVRAALARLSPDQREAIELAYFFGLSQSEIAEHLGQPLGTIKTRVRLGMMKLRELLCPLKEDLGS